MVRAQVGPHYSNPDLPYSPDFFIPSSFPSFNMNNYSLVILAAGIGSRYGGLKQLEPIGPNQACLMDYAIYDAYMNGCRHVVVIIRKIILDPFSLWINKWTASSIKIDFAYQEDTLANGKPPGTAHAVWCAQSLLKSKFVVVNADDYYGKAAFESVFHFLKKNTMANNFCLPGFSLNTTLSDNGGVSRGICITDVDGKLLYITERKNIIRTGGVINCGDGQMPVELPAHSIVSMNMWGFDSSLFQMLNHFFAEINLQTHTQEFYLPQLIQKFIDEQQCSVTVLPGKYEWIGVTFAEDKLNASIQLSNFVTIGLYPVNLYDACKS